MEFEREEGEMSDDYENAMLVDDTITNEQPTQNVISTTMYKADKNGLIIKQLEKIDASKLEERARRFGLDLTGKKLVTQNQIDELYVNCGIESGNKRHFRFDSVHLSGVDGLTTREIFEYLSDYKPVSLEWLDDNSCNIVCQDHISAALALLVHSREVKLDSFNKLSGKSHHYWRQGRPHPKQKFILMRFATNGDKKMTKKKPIIKTSDEYYDYTTNSVSKNPWGDLCQSWGVYDHQEIFKRKLPDDDYDEEDDEPSETVQIKNKKMAIRLGKRNHIQEDDESNSDSEWKKKSKTPRMRMHADDEESKQRKKSSPDSERELSTDRDIYAPLSIEVVNSSNNCYFPKATTKLSDKFKTHIKNKIHKKPSVQSRLGSKVMATEDDLSNDDSSNSSIDQNVMSRVQRVSSRINIGSNSNVWSRLETNDHGKRLKDKQSDLRQILKSRRQKQCKTDDLRDKISKAKQSNLRIEIDNHYARS